MRLFAGCRTFETRDESTGRRFPLLAVYPAEVPEQLVRLGPYELSVAMDAPLAEPKANRAGMGSAGFPLVVVSHGSGGSHLVYRSLMLHLARQGYVVVSPEHPQNNRNDNSLGPGAIANLENRPRLIRQVIDWVHASPEFGGSIRRGVAAVAGHSMGGYTALAVAGGRPSAYADGSMQGEIREVEVMVDPRVQALVLLAPATPWYRKPGSLAEVRVPIQMWTAEKDPHTPAWQGEIVANGVADPGQVDHRIVINGGHFSFLTQFPEAMRNPGFPPSQDPPGFDRDAFHQEFHREVTTFLDRVFG